LRKEGTPNPKLAAVVRTVVERRAELDPDLEFPQSTCSFVFGPEKRSMTIGALYLLWDSGAPWRQTCWECGGDLRGLACGGLLTFSAMSMVCLDCERAFSETSGKSIAAAVSWLNPLKDTRFHMSGGAFGGAHKSDGRSLLRVLNLNYVPAGQVSYRISPGSEHLPGGQHRRRKGSPTRLSHRVRGTK
jgi:hypothetical protein